MRDSWRGLLKRIRGGTFEYLFAKFPDAMLLGIHETIFSKIIGGFPGKNLEEIDEDFLYFLSKSLDASLKEFLEDFLDRKAGVIAKGALVEISE